MKLLIKKNKIQKENNLRPNQLLIDYEKLKINGKKDNLKLN